MVDIERGTMTFITSELQECRLDLRTMIDPNATEELIQRKFESINDRLARLVRLAENIKNEE